MESIRGGLLELVGWLDLRLITNEFDKGSGISTGNNHHNLRRGRWEERYPMVRRTLRKLGTRRGTPEGLVPVVYQVWGVYKGAPTAA